MSAGFKAKSALINDAGSGMTVPWPTGALGLPMVGV